MRLGERQLDFALIGRIGAGEKLYRLSESGGGQEERLFCARFLA